MYLPKKFIAAVVIAFVLFGFVSCFATSELPAQPPIAELQSLASRIESVIRSESEASNRPSMAMIDRETARSMNYDNQLKHVRTYYEKRKLSRQYRQAERLPRRSAAQIASSAKRAAPDRLSAQQYDAYSGRIAWPVILQQSGYQAKRTNLTRLFAAHARAGGGIQTRFYAAIQSTLGELQEQLDGNYKTSNPEQYTYAWKFLKSLRYEARFPVGS